MSDEKKTGIPPEEREAFFKEHGVEFKEAPDLSNPASWRTMPGSDLKRLLDEGIRIPKRGGGYFTFKTKQVNPFVEARKQRLKDRGR